MAGGIADIAINIRRARETARLTQDAAADAAGLSRAAYLNLEAGRSRPRAGTLLALSRALRVSPEDLLRPPAALPRARFRSLKRLNDRTGLLIAVGRQLDDYADLEVLLDARIDYQLAGLGAGLPERSQRPIEAAALARAALDLKPDEVIRDIGGLLEDRAGVKVLCLTAHTDGFFGLSVREDGHGAAVVVNVWDRISVERWIFTAAHELGHLVLHEDEYEDRSDAAEVAQSEQDADVFAGHFLMPDATFRREWAQASGLGFYEQVLKTKRIFRVSYKTVLYRAQQDFGITGVWARFQVEARKRTGKTLNRTDEPRALGRDAFGWGSPELSKAHEPGSLLREDFEPDRRYRLVRQAVESERISLARAGEILGRSLVDMKALQASWV